MRNHGDIACQLTDKVVGDPHCIRLIIYITAGGNTNNGLSCGWETKKESH